MKKKILSLVFTGMLLVNIGIAGNENPKPTASEKEIVICPLITLSSPPSTLAVGARFPFCSENLTVSTTTCTPFTFHFTWSAYGTCTAGSYTASTASGSAVLTFGAGNLNTCVGNTVHLYITDSGGNSSNNYDFTGVQACP